MNIRNVAESLGYAFEKFIIHTIIFSILFMIVSDAENIFYTVLSWCVPYATGIFLGYLGGKCFSFFIEIKNVFWAIVYLLVINFIAGLIINKILFQNEQWIYFVISIAIPIVFGYVNSIPAGLKSNIQNISEDSDKN